MLGEGSTFGINGNFGSPEKKLVLVLVKQKQKSAWVWIKILILVTYLLMWKKYLSLKPTTKC